MTECRWRSSVDECQRRKFSAQRPEDMLKLVSVASMSLPKYLLKLLTKANRDLMKEIPVGIPAEICDQRE